jgi:hypothetical protein
MGRKAKEQPPFWIIRDTREQRGWDFPADPKTGCQGTVSQTMPTGDYTIVGLEDKVVIERKANTGEFSQNITQERFERELVRLDAFPLSFVILEFDMSDLSHFPATSEIPRSKWKYLRITPDFLKKRLIEMQAAHSTRFILAGSGGGMTIANTIFRHAMQQFGVTPVEEQIAADVLVDIFGDKANPDEVQKAATGELSEEIAAQATRDAEDWSQEIARYRIPDNEQPKPARNPGPRRKRK